MGWFLRINIGGTNYYLADDTFDFSDKYIDIKTVLLSRYPENASVFTGSKLVRFNFGTASGNQVTSQVLDIKVHTFMKLLRTW